MKLQLYISEILDILLPYAAESAATPEAALALLSVVPRAEVPMLLSTGFMNENATPAPGRVAHLGRLDLLVHYPRYRLIKNASLILTAASAGGHIPILDWAWTHLRTDSEFFTSSLIEKYLHAASTHAQHAALAWWIYKTRGSGGADSDADAVFYCTSNADELVVEATQRADWATAEWWLTNLYGKRSASTSSEGRCAFLTPRALVACLAAAAKKTCDPIAAVQWWWSRAPQHVQDQVRGHILLPVVKSATAAGNVIILDWVMSVCLKNATDANATEKALALGTKDTMAFYRIALEDAVRNGHCQVLLWWESHYGDLSGWAFQHLYTAVSEGRVANLEWAYDRYFKGATKAQKIRFITDITTKRAVKDASLKGHLAMLEWLWNKGRATRWRVQSVAMSDLRACSFRGLFIGKDLLIDQISRNGHEKVLQFWFKVVGSADDWAHTYSDRAVDSTPNVAVLDWWWALHKAEGTPFRYSADAMDTTSRHDRIGVLDWWWQRHVLDDLELKYSHAAIRNAAGAGRAHVIRWWQGKHEQHNVPLKVDEYADQDQFPFKLDDLRDAPIAARPALFTWWATHILPTIQQAPNASNVLRAVKNKLGTVLKNAIHAGDMQLPDAWFAVVRDEPRLIDPELLRMGITSATTAGNYNALRLWCREAVQRGYTIPLLNVLASAGNALAADDPRVVQMWWHMHDALKCAPFHITNQEVTTAVSGNCIEPLKWTWDRCTGAMESVRIAFIMADPSAASVGVSQAMMALWYQIQSAVGIQSVEDAKVAERGCYVAKDSADKYRVVSTRRYRMADYDDDYDDSDSSFGYDDYEYGFGFGFGWASPANDDGWYYNGSSD
ncbi:hypothetical protein BC828DRAFT_413721 [Blastocladiella britannica]|nr:hypothetical protein BC828DRAFT_413721 [Blastocladiella britannica]